jgi:hypothetical protein
VTYRPGNLHARLELSIRDREERKRKKDVACPEVRRHRFDVEEYYRMG